MSEVHATIERLARKRLAELTSEIEKAISEIEAWVDGPGAIVIPEDYDPRIGEAFDNGKRMGREHAALLMRARLKELLDRPVPPTPPDPPTPAQQKPAE